MSYEPRIPYAYLTTERRNVTVSEYMQYKEMHPYSGSIDSLVCPECRDPITFADGDTNRPHFRHHKAFNEHQYCPFYKEGKESNGTESIIWKKFRDEMDIALNYEIEYRFGNWNETITIPPFSEEELQRYEDKKMTLTILREHISIPIDTSQFFPGEIKRITMPLSYGICKILISGKDNKSRIFEFDRFISSEQIYTTVISNEFIKDSEYLDLRNIHQLRFKRITGRVYTGKHYYIFARDREREKVIALRKHDCEVRSIIINRDGRIWEDLFDVVFNKLNQKTADFCLSRNCMLEEVSDAVVVWPPLNEIGNYKYFDSCKHVFVAFENENKSLELDRYFANQLFFIIRNGNSPSYYVTEALQNQKQFNPYSNFEVEDVSQIPGYRDNYLIKNEILINKINVDEFAGQENRVLLSIDSKLNRYYYQYKTKEKTEDLLMQAIKYSRKYIPFSDKQYNSLITKTDNKVAIEYLDSCLEKKVIKEEAYLEIMRMCK